MWAVVCIQSKMVPKNLQSTQPASEGCEEMIAFLALWRRNMGDFNSFLKVIGPGGKARN